MSIKCIFDFCDQKWKGSGLKRFIKTDKLSELDNLETLLIFFTSGKVYPEWGTKCSFSDNFDMERIYKMYKNLLQW